MVFLAASVSGSLPSLTFSTQLHAQQWIVVPTIELRELYTDNTTLDGDDKDGDLITTATASLSVSGRTDRITLNLDAGASYDKYIDRTELDGFRPNVLGVVELEVLKDTLFIDVRGSVYERNLSRSTATPAADRTFGGDRSLIVSYSVGSRFVTEVGDAAQLDAKVNLEGTSFNKPDVGDNSVAPDDRETLNAQVRLSSNERRLSKISWHILGELREESGRRSFSSRTVEGRLGWDISRNLSPFVRAGYDEFDDSRIDDDKRSGAFYLAGIVYKPGPRLTIEGEVGHRFGDLSGSGRIDYRITEQLIFAVIYNESVRTQQQSLNRRLLDLVFDDSGGLIDDIGAPPNLGNDNLDLIDETFKEARLSAGLNGTIGTRTHVNVTAFRTKRTFDAIDTDETVAGILASVTRDLSRKLLVEAGVIYSKTLNSRFPMGEDDADLGFNVGGTYRFSETFDVRLAYYRRDQNRPIDSDVTENSVILILRKSF